MNKGDIRAVENPITAIFDLAEDVETQSPKIRITIKYARIVIAFFLLVNALLIIVIARAHQLAFLLTPLMFLLLYVRRWLPDAGSRSVLFALAIMVGVFDVLAFGEDLLFGLVLVPFFFLGLITMGYLREIQGFFDYYALRHRIVKSVRDADPVANVPDGADSTQRLLGFLASRNLEIATLLQTPGAISAPTVLQGRSGMMYEFNAYLRKAPSGTWRVLGIGSPGFGLFVKAFPAPPKASDLQALKRAVEDICSATKIPPSRVVAVWRVEGDGRLPEDAYEFVTKEVVRFSRLGKEFTCSVQSIAETSDGTYDFIPFIPELAR